MMIFLHCYGLVFCILFGFLVMFFLITRCPGFAYFLGGEGGALLKGLLGFYFFFMGFLSKSWM